MPALIRSASTPASGAKIIVARGHGVSNSPQVTASLPNSPCRKKGNETIASIWAVNDSIDVEIDIEKTGMRSRSTGNNGYSCRNSRAHEKESDHGEQDRAGDDHPYRQFVRSPSIRPMIRKNVIALRMPPGMSKRRPRMHTGFTGRNL